MIDEPTPEGPLGDVHQLLALGDCRVSPYLSPLISVPVRFVIGYRIQSSFIAPLLARDKAREPMSALLPALRLALVLENLRLLFFMPFQDGAHPD